MIQTTFNSNKRLFGTDGIRGTVNKDKVTALMAVNLAMAAGEYFYGRAGTKRSRVLIGKDTRLSGYMLEPALVAGFTSVGLDSITTGPLPTPAIAHLTRVLRCDLGVMISASHNPYQDNGLKLFGADGFKLNDEVENEIQSRMVRGPILAKSENLGRARRMEDAIGRYSEFVKQILPKREDLSSMKVVLDCSNGASYKVGPEVLFELGADAVIIGAEPNGKNINLDCGAIYPENMAKITKLEGADLGIALDGDADRVIFSDENGEIINGDQIIAVLAREMQNNNELIDNQVVGTLMSNLGLENYLNKIKIHLHRTNVGDRYILDKMIKSNSKLGGEPSGHILLSDFAKTGDGLLTAIKILSLLKKSRSKASEFLRPFQPIPQSLKNIKNINKSVLLNKNIISLVEKHQEELGKKGRILLRPSGTEDLIRVMVECTDLNLLKSTIEIISKAIIKENDNK
ncbi:MAG: phosphoglucosamine mutase [Alphaproteobacteria bacterium TMED199]|nr:MAG: phosphoglucosamine mutase [Alphaproteobacteria bacterium TMED199]